MSKAVQPGLAIEARDLMKRYVDEVLAVDGTECHKVACDSYLNLCYTVLSGSRGDDLY